MSKRAIFIIFTVIVLLPQISQAAPVPIPNINIGITQSDNPADISAGMKILALLTILSLAPAILIMLTGFTRIVIVFHFLRQALGTQQMPPNQVIIGLSLFITFFIMSPYFIQINDEAIQPYLQKKISQEEAIEKATAPLKEFMTKQTRKKDLALFLELSKKKNFKSNNDIPFMVLVPSFIISELKTAFQIGFLIYIPFLIIDIVVSSVLLSMGMMMLPPVMISLPFKIVLFVLVDGWYLIVGSLLKSFY
ncbi:MAG: flagellar biosynthetic protein FliP [Candidatus Schekmanbacteria bacterium]|nr:MAG: flagellar biosynthetic protein FliP [Candidatus Schekmanbacteria bacterium]